MYTKCTLEVVLYESGESSLTFLVRNGYVWSNIRKPCCRYHFKIANAAYWLLLKYRPINLFDYIVGRVQAGIGKLSSCGA